MQKDKTKRKIKEFLTPTPAKLLFAFIIFSVIPVFLNSIPMACLVGPSCPPIQNYVSLLAAVFIKMGAISSVQIGNILPTLFIIPGLIVSYFIPASLLFLWKNKIEEGTKLSFKENLIPSKGKLILSILGWITVFWLYIFRSPTIPESMEVLMDDLLTAGILLPFSLLTVFVFHPSIVLFRHLSKVPILSSGDFHATPPLELFPSPSSVSSYVATVDLFVTIPLFMIEWYLFSCLIVYVFEKIRSFW